MEELKVSPRKPEQFIDKIAKQLFGNLVYDELRLPRKHL
jgi:hypothetical protein